MKSVQIFRHKENLHNFVVVYLCRPNKANNVCSGAWPVTGVGDVSDKHGNALQKLLANAYDKFVIFKQTPKVITNTTSHEPETACKRSAFVYSTLIFSYILTHC